PSDMGSVNPVLRQLRDWAWTSYSPVAVHVVAAALSGPSREAGWSHRPHLGQIAPVWEVVNARIRADAAYGPSFVLLIIAGGILTNSQILMGARSWDPSTARSHAGARHGDCNGPC